MSMEINGTGSYPNTGYARQLQEKQALERAGKADGMERGQDSRKASPGAEAPQDEYVSSEASGTKPNGLYWLGKDGTGSPKVFYNDPNRPSGGEGTGQPKADGSHPGKPAKECTANTDKVDREIRKLKEEKKRLEQQLKAASGDEKKARELEHKLAQVESELSQKDNDAYRRQHTAFSE